jgi:hypothetical protein
MNEHLIQTTLFAIAVLLVPPVSSTSGRWPQGELEIRITTGTLEPGVFGILRPELMVPEGILSSLSEPHAVVEVLFWFHPLVWWIGKTAGRL